MPQEPLLIEDMAGPKEGQRVLRLTGPITISNLFEFQTMVRTNTVRQLIIDFSKVPYMDSAGIGALVGAYVTHQKDERNLSLVAVCERVHHALQVTQVEKFFRFYDSVEAAAG